MVESASLGPVKLSSLHGKQCIIFALYKIIWVMQNLDKVLNKWFKGLGKPNSVDGKWNIMQVIEYRRIMGMSHHLQVYTATEDQYQWMLEHRNRTREQMGELRQIKRRLKQRQWECI
jgi:hypothetical protein